VTAGYVGAVRATVPLTAAGGGGGAAGAAGAPDACADVELDELLISLAPAVPGERPATAAVPAPPQPGPLPAPALFVRPASGGAAAAPGGGWEDPGTAAAAAAAAQAPSGGLGPLGGLGALLSLEDAAGGLGQSSVADGIRCIAGGLEAMLQRMSVVARNVTVRVELPASVGGEAILHFDCLRYQDATPAPAPPPGAAGAAAAAAAKEAGGKAAGAPPCSPAPLGELFKDFELEGLTLELLRDGSGGRGTEAPGGTVATQAAPGRGGGHGRGAASMQASFMAASADDARQLLAGGAAGAALGSWPDDGAGGVLLGGPSPGSGVDVSLQLKLTWHGGAGGAATPPAAATPGAWPHVSLEVGVSALHLALQPWQLPLLYALAAAAGGGDGASCAEERVGPGCGAAPPASAAQPVPSSAAARLVAGATGAPSIGSPGAGAWGQRSFMALEGLLLPHCEGLVAESLGLGYTAPEPAAGPLSGALWGPPPGSGGGGGAVSVYADARSVFDSGGSSLLSSQLASSGYGYGSALICDGGGAGAGSPAGAPTFSLRVTAQEVSAALYYAAGRGAAAGAHLGTQPAGHGSGEERVEAACAGLVLSADAGPKGYHVTLKLYRLEACEHLDGGGTAAGAAAECAAAPALLPAGPPGLRPAPRRSKACGGGVEGVMDAAGCVVWPLLCCGGGAMESGGLPNVGKPSLRLEVGLAWGHCPFKELCRPGFSAGLQCVCPSPGTLQLKFIPPCNPVNALQPGPQPNARCAHAAGGPSLSLDPPRLAGTRGVASAAPPRWPRAWPPPRLGGPGDAAPHPVAHARPPRARRRRAGGAGRGRRRTRQPDIGRQPAAAAAAAPAAAAAAGG
jgi:hypothetical protein